MEVIDVESRVVTPAAGVPETALIVSPHPLTLAGQRVFDAQQAAFLPGETLATFLARHDVEPGQQWTVCLGGIDVPESRWHLVRPKHGWIVEARRVPGKQALAIVAVLVLSYFTAGIAGGALAGTLGSGFAAGTIGAAVAAGAVSMAGALVINKLLGPKAVKAAAQQKDSPSYAISGGRNRMRLFEPMGLVLGQPYCVPDLSAQPFTYFADDEQYLWQVFHAGLNCAAVSSIRIGETLATSYQDVTLSYDGFPAGNTGLPALAGSVDTIAGALLDAPTAPGPWTTRTTSAGTVQIAIDLELALSFFGEKGYQTANVQVEFQFRSVGSQNWNSLGAPVFSSNSAKPLRRTLTYPVPAGQYEVRGRKLADANYTVTGASNVVTWTTLKSYQVDTGNYGGQARVGLQIRATGQLSGAVDELNWQATAKSMPYWNGSAWTTATSRDNGLSNPGAQILLLARGVYDDAGKLVAGLGMADSLIDIESLQGFMVHCAARGFTFDYFLQETTSIGDLIDVIAAAGLGSRSWHTGRLGVIWFSDNQPVEGVFNMTTMKAKSFSVDYDTPATAEELEFQYFDRQRGNAWQSIRVVAPGVTTPTSTARNQLIGVTTEVHAGILARFSMAQNVYQRKTVNCEIDLEHLVVRRGTVVALSHDVTQWGYGGRLRGASIAGSTVTLALDDVVPSVSPSGATTRYVGLRLPGERSYRVFPVQAFSGDTRTLVLASAWPSGVPVPGAAVGNPAEDTVWIYDFRSTPGQKLRIAEISPTGNMEGARLALVPESPEFWNYVFNGTYTPPPTTTLLGLDLPVAKELRVTKAQRRVGDAWVTDLTATFVVTGNFGSVQVWAGADGAALEQVGGDVYGGSVTWTVDRGLTWTVEVRPFDPLGHIGTIASTAYGLTTGAVAAVTGLALAVQPEGIMATFNPPTGLDAVDWSLTRLQIGSTWDLNASAYQGKVSRFNIGFRPAGTLQVLAAHKTTAGDWSTPVSATLTIAAPAQPLVTGNSAIDGVELAWQDCRTTQPLATYRISTGPTQAGAAPRGQTLATQYKQVETIIATRRYWVVAVDAGGNVSAGGYIELASGGDINTTIVAATTELKNGLDTVTAQITNPATGLAAVKLLAEAASQGQAIQYLEQADDLNTLAQTTLRSLLQGNDGQLALAAARSEIYTRVASGLSAESAQRLQLALIVGRQQGSLTQIAQVMSDQYGNLSARWGVTLDVNGRITGVELLGTGQQTTAVWLVDKFGIGLPGANGQTVYPFIVGTVNGQPSVAVNGNLFVDGSIIARHLATAIITADKIAAGAITADKMAVNSITAQNAALGDASVDTLKVAGQAITVPAYVAGPTNDLYLNYNISGTGSFQVYIHCSMTMAFTGSFEIYIDGQMRYAGAAIGGTLAGVGFSPVLSAGSHVIRLYSDKTTNANNSSIYALATKR